MRATERRAQRLSLNLGQIRVYSSKMLAEDGTGRQTLSQGIRLCSRFVNYCLFLVQLVLAIALLLHLAPGALAQLPNLFFRRFHKGAEIGILEGCYFLDSAH